LIFNGTRCKVQNEWDWDEIAFCPTCGSIIAQTQARWDSGALDYCFGCCGYPFCSCPEKHTGDCTKETMKQ
jgi:hypothetical protein